MNKFASAHWEGDIKKGKGTISTQSGALKEQPYGFNTRFEDEPGTNPEELIGAAHAGCFSMAFSLELGNAGYTADSIDTKAKVTLDKDGDGFSITKIHLDMNAKIPGIDDAEFQKIANGAKEGCPVSKVLNAEITLDAKLG
ncbi:MAG: OsmC family protein [Alloalcanivorax venustensis]|jgi:osmotically inducible protein OsmC|uniref:OsmC subfamily peroxiredoxin n=1 Tax=Alloalcanivorax venustensis ISO4 TaxID=1177184 RepID=A0ABS0AIH0_9GAMM|nr:OsmC family protein [Alloalcanivorax venustensis]MAD71227.1 OsmC family peroxiredoxin [Alcanivorax sp.]MED5603193.1 OsmC family protein [Pseudomonadota bacterium]MBF5053936.1 OsmC subfamily peroxiredoxin [Alloalcanivorax venustensis ISO4]MBG11644.1 OsmC family peroxiredoxin [Alcanivorax sp.]MBG14383.1 OsmC family peroxiredoxin [Alcanivorax sp.]|tara:strand:- start:48220 stop:48642 length:423 start_codon:yes stop_codon:yes gene_type:complete